MTDDFTTRISAELSGLTPTEYRVRNALLLAELPRLSDPPAIESEEQYRGYVCIVAGISSLWCSLFNSGDVRADDVAKVEGSYTRRMSAFNDRFLVRDRRHCLVARYLLWSRRFSDVSPKTAMLAAREFGLLRRAGGQEGSPINLFVVGLKRKQGDNVFHVDKFGRHHRRYLRTIGRQAFLVLHPSGMDPAEFEDFVRTIPELDDTYRTVQVCDAKHASRASSFTAAARSELFNLLSGDWASALSLDRPPSSAVATAVAASSIDPPSPSQLGLWQAA